MKGKAYIIVIFILMISITSGCSNEEKPKILSEQAIEVPEDKDVIDCNKITYLSDGLEVVGYFVKPKEIDGKLPVIIYNRGGNRDYGKITERVAINYLGYLASKNYVVLASQYRGNDGGEGKEELGGSDLNDVLNLIEIAKDLPYVNKKQIFMIGGSRGGMMTYMACRKSKEIKAAVVIAGVSDFIQSYNYNYPLNQYTLAMFVGATLEENKEEYINRSACYWADDINTPLLIIHGAKDKRVPIIQAEKMAEELKKYNKIYKLIIYPDEGHKFSWDKWFEARDESLKWLDKYKNN